MERGWEECDNERPLVFDIKLEIATDNADPDDMVVVEGNNDNILQAEATTSPVIGGWIGEERWKWKGGPRKFNLNSEPRKNTVNL